MNKSEDDSEVELLLQSFASDRSVNKKYKK